MAERWKQTGTDIVYELAGSFLAAIGLYNFSLAARLPLVGFSGIGFLINYFTRIPLGWAIILLNIPVALLCFRVLGRGFYFRSMRCMLISSLMLDYLAPLLPVYQGDRLLAALSTSVLCGLGYAIIYLRNDSTGGMDFIIMSVKTWRPDFPLGKITFAFDVIVLLAESIVLRDVDGMIYGLMVSYLSSVVVDKTIFGFNSGKMVLIVTEQGDVICRMIGDICRRGSTILPGFGGYMKANKQVILSVCSSKQMAVLQRAVKEIDPAAFTIVLEAHEIQGNGFQKLQFGDGTASGIRPGGESGPAGKRGRTPGRN